MSLAICFSDRSFSKLTVCSCRYRNIFRRFILDLRDGQISDRFTDIEITRSPRCRQQLTDRWCSLLLVVDGPGSWQSALDISYYVLRGHKSARFAVKSVAALLDMRIRGLHS